MRDLSITPQPVDGLTANAHNARTHSAQQIRRIAESIRTFGFTNPVLVDDNNLIIAGHGRVAAARQLGMASVPTIRLSDMSEAQKRAYVLADNKLAERAGWDTELLALELQYLTTLELDFDVTVTGFDTAEIDILLADAGAEADEAADSVPPADPDATPVSRPGDLWRLGRHRLLCADATAADSFARLMHGKQAQMVFVDPPFNVPISGHVGGLGEVQHREFAMAAGEMSEAEFTGFLQTIFCNLAASSIDGAIHYVCMDWRHIFEVLAAGRAVYTEQKNLCVWNKSNGGMGTFYRSKHELVFVFKHGTAAHINNFELGQHGRNRTNVWDYAGVNSLKPERMAELRMHPTTKPVALVADAIRDCSRRGGIVLDCFAGSGTTLIAAERTGRRGYGMELDPLYTDTTIRRWQEYTGEPAVHVVTGTRFDDIAMAAGPLPQEKIDA